MTSAHIHIHGRLTRLWHWTQAALVCGLALTGFEAHGSFKVLGFERAVSLHHDLAILYLALVGVAAIGSLVTGQWRRIIPTRQGLGAMVRYYAVGMFAGESTPFIRTPEAKYNPAQRLTYFALNIVIMPLVIVSGLLYAFSNAWPESMSGQLGAVAVVHTAGAFLALCFAIVHVYMTTTGETPLSHIKAMITGYEDPPQS
jgi:thiosulfate reductase cytochrome b subunit